MPIKNYSRCDLAIAGLTPTAAREKDGVVFSKVTVKFSQSLLIRKQDYITKRITSYQSFKNSKMKIGVVPATTGELYAKQQASENKLPAEVIVGYKSESELLPALMKGEIDAIARGEIGNEYQESINPDVITIAKKSYQEGFSFAMDPSNKLLVKELNQAITEITDEGKITYQQWLRNHHVFMERVAILRN